ncbi:protein FAM50A-like [Lingula anatina]|uniref:Protein FAM50A-like n=1 Tax=Lingula anatina TaxID=7574 RepID=A0A1S3JXY3_LINAN|nr:protein FAM50A-like [Lingula anatina]XP_013415167.1 protein FAM50A-like [Lingula anatina]XP_013415169.1 protein FAM50A-like [Lingula anatina]|eukprot:XP_013415166.1 protein FAM50A-like [Lingula anatina]
MAFYKGASKEAGRAMQLIKKRQKEHDEMEAKKKKIEEELQVGSIHNKFAAHYDAIEQQLKSDTVGLVTLDEMKAKQEDVIKEREKQLALKERASKLDKEREKEKKKREKRALQKAMLSFDVEEDAEEEEEEEEEQQKTEEKMSIETEKKKKRLGMNPDVDTSFLPDKDREEEENRIREELRQEWAAKQEELKNENIEITYSYWDGSGHRRTVQMKKGNSIQQFLQRCLETLRKEFAELKSCSVDQLMYVKEDLIIPQHYTFYDFIVTKARGKSGPLFNFDVHDDVRMISDARVEKDESHAGKVCLRSWYERNKHIFPASRWEPYDPEKKWDKYTVADKNAAKITVK